MMTSPQLSFAHLIDALGAELGIPLSAHDGVCALYDSQDHEAAVIERPSHSEMVILHCQVARAPQRAADLQSLLALNFDVAQMHGCWFALDQGDVRLCTQREWAAMSEAQFCNLARGFMAQAREARSRLQG